MIIKLNLDKLWPSDIIALCDQRLITIDEIVASRRHLTAFGDELRDYVLSAQRAQAKLVEVALDDTVV